MPAHPDCPGKKAVKWVSVLVISVRITFAAFQSVSQSP